MTLGMANGSAPAAKKGGGAQDRREPVGELHFRVELPNAKLGYFRECGGLTVEVEVKEYMEGGQNGFVHKLPTRLKYPNVVLKRGVTDSNTLMAWAQQSVVKAERVEMTLRLVGPDGQVVQSWAFANAYPVKWTGPTLNAGSNQIATETLEITHTGMRTP